MRLVLLEKAASFIGAFVELQDARYLISDNRHFLSDLAGEPFDVLRPEDFIQRYYQTIKGEEVKNSND